MANGAADLDGIDHPFDAPLPQNSVAPLHPHRCFEDMKRVSNADIGRKDFLKYFVEAFSKIGFWSQIKADVSCPLRRTSRPI